jgi:phage gp36-like protein
LTTPAPVLYATEADLKLALSGTDSGTGTAVQLSDAQINLALIEASNRVSTYAGQIYDSSSPGLTPPPMLQSLTLDIAVFYATTYYMKHKDMAATHPVWLKYTEAMKMLNDVRDGKIVLNIYPPSEEAQGIGGPVTGHVINRVPDIFTGEDSNTTTRGGVLQADVPPEMSHPGLWDIGYTEYQ